MLSRLRGHLGGAGLVVAIVALSVALAGGAIAANGGSGDGKATASAKAKKGPRGPKGPKGDTGPAGPAGPAGPQGAKGDAGAAGSNGSNGSNGATGATGSAGAAGDDGDDGKSATVTPFDGETEPGGNPCNEFGGLEIEVEGSGEPSIVCNGETGFTDTLPPGKTETGAWAGMMPSSEFVFTPISFTIPLAVAPEGNVAPDPDCPGTVDVPKAAPGHFCLYVGSISGTIPNPPVLTPPDSAGSLTGTTSNGTLVEMEGPPGSYGFGTWAVTAATGP